jgi:tetratricopeptide (TPR) repeat protein
MVMEFLLVQTRLAGLARESRISNSLFCDPGHRANPLGGFFRSIAGVLAIRSLIVLLMALVGGGLPTISPAQAYELDDVLERLDIMLPVSIAHMSSVRRPLEELQRERCDRAAIANLADALQKLGRRREAATAQLNFSRSCDSDAASVRRAVNILLQLNDHAEVVSAATELIKLEPYSDNGYFLRALGHDRGGNCNKAIDDYATASNCSATRK